MTDKKNQPENGGENSFIRWGMWLYYMLAISAFIVLFCVLVGTIHASINEYKLPVLGDHLLRMLSGASSAVPLAAMAALLSIPLVLYRAYVLSRQTSAQERQQRTAEANLQHDREAALRSDVTNRYLKAIELLGASHSDGRPNIEIRLGAISTLSAIAKENIQEHHWTIMQILLAYIRERRGPEALDFEALTKEERAREAKVKHANKFAFLPRSRREALAWIIEQKQKHLKSRQRQPFTARQGLLRQRLRADKRRNPLPKDVSMIFAVLQQRNADHIRAEFGAEPPEMDRTAFAQENPEPEEDAPLNERLDYAKAWARHVEAWKKSALNPIKKFVLTTTPLRHADLSGIDWRLQDLKSARMEGADLSYARMEGADLREARMEGAVLHSASLEGADLRNAQMEGADLHDVRMQGADIRGAQMEGANLMNARMEGAIIYGALMNGANLRGARMEGASFNKAQMEGADLRDVQMQGATLIAATMQGADLRGAQMEGVSLNHTRMEGAILSDAQMEGAVLSGAWMERAVLNNARMEGAILSGAWMKKAVLWCVKMEGVNLRGATLEGADLSLARMEGADLSDARMEGVDLRSARMERADLSKARMEGACVARAEFVQRSSPRSEDENSTSPQGEDRSAKGLTQEMINSTFGDAATRLPPGLERPDHWAKEKLDAEQINDAWAEWKKDQGFD